MGDGDGGQGWFGLVGWRLGLLFDLVRLMTVDVDIHKQAWYIHYD